jgi:hypothetical protein
MIAQPHHATSADNATPLHEEYRLAKIRKVVSLYE